MGKEVLIEREGKKCKIQDSEWRAGRGRKGASAYIHESERRQKNKIRERFIVLFDC